LVVENERLTLRFPFIATAEIAPESSPSASIRATVKELSLRGCYLEAPAPFSTKTRVLVKIFVSEEYFEAKATVVYVHPMLGMDLAFREVKPNFRVVLQKWLLVAMQNKTPE
jgi:PilZ domain